ncbi:MAG: hypothetical protein A3J97_12965, partial [Spirochaetes bacterium RIFOXYC1_FULL_54_7]
VMPWSPSIILGMSPAEAIERLGAPDRVYAVRGAEAWQDDVVFDYGDGLSLFLFADRVWQVRIAEPYPLPVLGFILGGTQDDISAVLGFPAAMVEGDPEWMLTGEAWPVRLRAIPGEDGYIRELYVYRADF